jgi:hypothetical protein
MVFGNLALPQNRLWTLSPDNIIDVQWTSLYPLFNACNRVLISQIHVDVDRQNSIGHKECKQGRIHICKREINITDKRFPYVSHDLDRTFIRSLAHTFTNH